MWLDKFGYFYNEALRTFRRLVEQIGFLSGKGWAVSSDAFPWFSVLRPLRLPGGLDSEHRVAKDEIVTRIVRTTELEQN